MMQHFGLKVEFDNETTYMWNESYRHPSMKSRVYCPYELVVPDDVDIVYSIREANVIIGCRTRATFPHTYVHVWKGGIYQVPKFHESAAWESD